MQVHLKRGLYICFITVINQVIIQSEEGYYLGANTGMPMPVVSVKHLSPGSGETTRHRLCNIAKISDV